MKKAVLILLVLTMIVSTAAIAPINALAADEQATKIGSVSDDYRPEGTAVVTAEEFAAMKADGKYYLAADIELSSSYADSFTGVFDGNGHTVTTTATLFVHLNGTVKNLIINGSLTDNAVLDAASPSKSINGVLSRYAAFEADTVITNVCNNAKMVSNYNGMAGIVGYGGGGSGYKLTITDCANYGLIVTDINPKVNRDSGGIIGGFYGKADQFDLVIENCVNYGIVNASGRSGGIAGTIKTSAKLINCTNNGKIQGIDNHAAGIVARIGEIDKTVGKTMFVIEGCVNNADISYSGAGEVNAAGIVGLLGASKSVTIKNCTNNGTITAVDNGKAVAVGGIVADSDVPSPTHVADTDGTLILDGCVNNGRINILDWSKSAANAGGIAGLLESHYHVELLNCTNKAAITVKTSSSSTSHCGGIVGSVDNYVTVTGCINTGDISCVGGNKKGRSGGIIGGASNSAKSDLILNRCGNTGDIEGDLAAAGLVAYYASGKDYGPFITYCFNNGNISSQKWAAGLLGYANAGRGKISFCYVAGKVTNTETPTTVSSGDQVDVRVQYTFNHDGTDYYFYAPMEGKITINSDGTVTMAAMTQDAAKARNGKKATAQKVYYFDASGTRYYFVSETKGTISINDTKVTVGGAEPFMFTANVPIYDHRIDAMAVGYSDTRTFEVDMDTIYVEDGCADTAYVMGAAKTFKAIGAVNDSFTTYAIDDFASGKIAYQLNEGAKRQGAEKDVFYQNLVAKYLKVDVYPTTDDAHAAVTKLGNDYTNIPFEMNPDCTPATGDATVYAAIVCVAAVIALGGTVAFRKKKAEA